jgi:ATP-binding cassette subfamily B protein
VRLVIGEVPDQPAVLSSAERLVGLGKLMVVMLFLYIAISALTGLAFFIMTWAGARVLKSLREQVFAHLHRLSISYYAEHETGDLMSRITNDVEAIQQAVNFALLNVIGGVMLLVWIAYSMLRMSVPFGLLSLSILPLMAVTTVWFSSQARRAFRRTRREMGSVNAELQESIAAVREVQAFNRADENIENFRLTNAANRDANVKLRLPALSCPGSPGLPGSGDCGGSGWSDPAARGHLHGSRRIAWPGDHISDLCPAF